MGKSLQHVRVDNQDVPLKGEIPDHSNSAVGGTQTILRDEKEGQDYETLILTVPSAKSQSRQDKSGSGLPATSNGIQVVSSFMKKENKQNVKQDRPVSNTETQFGESKAEIVLEVDSKSNVKVTTNLTKESHNIQSDRLKNISNS